MVQVRQQGSLCPCLDSVIRQQLHQLQALQRRGSLDLSLASQLDTQQLQDTQLARRRSMQGSSSCSQLDTQQLQDTQLARHRSVQGSSSCSQLDTKQLEGTQLARRGCSQLVAMLDKEQRRSCVLPGGGQLQRARRRRGGGAQLPAVHITPCTPQLDPGPRHTSSVSTGDNMHRLNINM